MSPTRTIGHSREGSAMKDSFPVEWVSRWCERSRLVVWRHRFAQSESGLLRRLMDVDECLLELGELLHSFSQRDYLVSMFRRAIDSIRWSDFARTALRVNTPLQDNDFRAIDSQCGPIQYSVGESCLGFTVGARSHMVMLQGTIHRMEVVFVASQGPGINLPPR
jgi:hypothetical protein